ncbi:HCL497Cp [Eremothecium sinecaudum]|uniref:Biogenesis of lysosome-related organelles complex 1 subunit BLI1 n=1 Tax=Eremothecium sinecaudum TaxID=45286 RepID=A0A120K1R2_9SACH|nr:HCL497Cp [Eremothecium sinecaudum]AMD19654.1 HCL497Cp [Eremothecium sinecaudum]
MKEKQLRRHLDKCVDDMQIHVDLMSARAISKFTADTNANYEWLNQIKQRHSTRHKEELRNYFLLKAEYEKKVEVLDSKVTYLEQLAEELCEFQNELAVKVQRVKRAAKVADDEEC